MLNTIDLTLQEDTVVEEIYSFRGVAMGVAHRPVGPSIQIFDLITLPLVILYTFVSPNRCFI